MQVMSHRLGNQMEKAKDWNQEKYQIENFHLKQGTMLKLVDKKLITRRISSLGVEHNQVQADGLLDKG